MGRCFLVCVFLLLTGCGPIAVKMYDGPERKASEHAVVSSIPTVGYTFVVGIDDKEDLNIARTAEYLLLPGRRLITLVSYENYETKGNITTYDKITTKVYLDAKAGHTYIPVQRYGSSGGPYFIDKGLNYNRKCLPVYVKNPIWGKPCGKEYLTGK